MVYKHIYICGEFPCYLTTTMYNLDQLFISLLSQKVRKLISPLRQGSRSHVARCTLSAIKACQQMSRITSEMQWKTSDKIQATCNPESKPVQRAGVACNRHLEERAVLHWKRTCICTRNSRYKLVHIFSWFALPFSHRNIFGCTEKMRPHLKGCFVSLQTSAASIAPSRNKPLTGT